MPPRTLILIALAACSAAFASEPGQPLDCSDMVFQQPGYTCTSANPQLSTRKGSSLAVDNTGRQFTVTDGSSFGGQSLTINFVDPASGDVSEFAHIASRSGPNGTWDVIRTSKPCSDIAGQLGAFPCGGYESYVSDVLWFDPVAGALFIPTQSYCAPGPCTYGSAPGGGVLRIDGFARLFDIFQTYQPPSGPISFRVPAMPDGLRAVGHFDTYWGDLRTPIEFKSARGLRCHYPEIAPSIGDYLVVADSLPAPAPGTGYYYITAVQFEGQTRFGRKAVAGRLVGRDPAALPTCSEGTEQPSVAVGTK